MKEEPRLVVVEEEPGGLNRKFKDTKTGQIMSVEDIANNIKSYPEYHVFRRGGRTFIRSNPDGTKDNNLK